MISFNIATVERRQDSFRRVMGCLANQTLGCDRINIAFSYAPPDDLLNYIRDNFSVATIVLGTFPASYKMFAFDTAPDDSYFLTFDDDIMYPSAYCSDLVYEIQARKDTEVVGYHGMRFNVMPVTNFYDRTIFQYFDLVPDTVRVHVIGTGCSGFYVKTLRDAGFNFNYFQQFPNHGNFNDMTFALFLREQQIRMTVLAHQKGWLSFYPGTQDGNALWKQSDRHKAVELSYLQQGDHL
jgi:hypothetical protein